jgi:hypothetical protein
VSDAAVAIAGTSGNAPSPTRATVSPSGIVKLMPRAAASAVVSNRKCVAIRRRIAVAADRMTRPNQRVVRIGDLSR